MHSDYEHTKCPKCNDYHAGYGLTDYQTERLIALGPKWCDFFETVVCKTGWQDLSPLRLYPHA